MSSVFAAISTRIRSPSRTRATVSYTHLDVYKRQHVCVIPVDLALGAEAVVRQFFQRDEVGALLGAGATAELEALPRGGDEWADDPVTRKNRLRILGLGVPLVGTSLGREAGDRTCLLYTSRCV